MADGMSRPRFTTEAWLDLEQIVRYIGTRNPIKPPRAFVRDRCRGLRIRGFEVRPLTGAPKARRLNNRAFGALDYRGLAVMPGRGDE